MKLAVLCDFDGTIASIDTGLLLLQKFGHGNWEEYDARLEKGEITLEQCLVAQYAMIKASKEEILLSLEREKIEIRLYFEEFMRYCKVNDFPFVIVTGGIDFCINHVLKRYDSCMIHSGKSIHSLEGIQITFPPLTCKESINFKDDLVEKYRKLGHEVVYIGDGHSDYEPSKKADLVFAVKGSSLGRMCKRNKIEHVEFTNFSEVQDKLITWTRARTPSK
ncbi:MAG: MtnX-like HAD-IB family phosphatase [Nitrososphaerales archaeon]